MSASSVEQEQFQKAQARLERMITWLLRAVAVGMLLFVVNYLLNPAQETIFSIGVSMVALSFFLYARAQARLGRLQLAALLLSGLILTIALVNLMTLPSTSPGMMVLFPVLSVGLALPYLDRERLRWLLVVAWAATVEFAVVFELRRLEAGVATSGWATGIVLIAILSGLIFLAIWQFSVRINETVAQVQRVNQELKVTRLQLEDQVAQARRLQQEADEGRERRERAVEGYVAFVQDVGRGNVERRMALQEEGVLGQLTVGLNLMAEDLQESQAEAQRLLRAEEEARQRLQAAVQHTLRFV